MGFTIVATRGTAAWLLGQGVPVSIINKVLEGQPHIVDAITDGEIAMIFNTTEGVQSLKDSQSIRMAAWARRIPIFTTAAASDAAVQAIAAVRERPMQVRSIQEYHAVTGA